LEIPTEDLTAAALREMSKEQTDPRAFLVGGGKVLTSILSGDYRRLKAILARLKQ
jgi:dihydrofolate reductase